MKVRSIRHPLALAALLAMGTLGSAIAGPQVTLAINGQSVALPAPRIVSTGSNSAQWLFEDFDAVLGDISVRVANLAFGYDQDPEITYSLSAVSSDAPLSLQFWFSSPYIAGPYDLMPSQHSSLALGSDQTTVTIAPQTGSTHIHQVSLDGVAIPALNLGTGCSFTAGPAVCDPLANAGTGVTSLTSGVFGIFVAFQLSGGGDSYAAQGRADLLDSNAVPEPGSILFTFAGLATIVLRKRV